MSRPPEPRWLSLGEPPPDLARPAVWLVRDDDPAWAAMVAGLSPSPADLADAALFAAPARAARRLARRMLLKALVGRVHGVPPAQVAVERSAAGAIAIAAPRPLCASLSARDGWTMVGLAQAPVGVDVEAADPAPPLPLDVLSAEEAGVVAGLAAAAQADAFARFWVVKEAVLKARGTGLNLDPARLTVRLEAEAAEVFEPGGARPCALAWIRRGGTGVAAVAVLA